MELRKKIPGVQVKASLLSNGLALSQKVLQQYGHPYLEKRRAYGNPDPLDYEKYSIPQELYILPEKLITSVNIKESSPWLLDVENEEYFLKHNDYENIGVTFPLRPEFYDQNTTDGRPVNSLITLYGGGSLGMFVNGRCIFADAGMACHYCSIVPNRNRHLEFEKVIKIDDAVSALEIALQDKSLKIKQVMLNGGIFQNIDNNFVYYAELAKKVEELVKSINDRLEVHLITFPPKDFSLLKAFKGSSIKIAMNTEVFDADLFAKYCPGKAKIVGRQRILDSLEFASEILGPGRVYSILVGGLESLETLTQGIEYIAQRGVTPVINVLHTDPETPLEHFTNPSTEYILQAGKILQDAYQKYSFKPFYEDCGRNSLDTEAFRLLF